MFTAFLIIFKIKNKKQNKKKCEASSVSLSQPTSPFAVKKNTFLGKNKYKKNQKVRVLN